MFRSLPAITLMISALYGLETQDLSPEKQSLFEQQRQEIDSSRDKLRYDWISPLTLKASSTYDQSAATDTHNRRESASAGIAQDLFRSGGITYAIGYADAKYHADLLGLRKDMASAKAQLTTAVLNYQKNRLLLDQSELKLKNYRIEIFLKRKQYEAGDIDITLLNNALMNQSNELKTNAVIRMNLSHQKYEAAKLSDRLIETIQLPRFTLVSKETFIEDNWDLRYTKAKSESAAQQYGQVKSAYYPKLTLLANAGTQQYRVRENRLLNYSGNFYDAGLQLSYPLTYNASAATQEAQAAYLKLHAQSADTQRQIEASYKQTLMRIENYDRLIAITHENLAYYDELLGATKAAVTSGYKAGYDLQTLQNTKAIEAAEIAINDLNIQLELAALHFMIQHPQENP